MRSMPGPHAEDQKPIAGPPIWGTLPREQPNKFSRASDVCYGSLADICERIRDVCFTPKSGHAQRQSRCRLSANSGPSVVGLKFHGGRECRYVAFKPIRCI